LFRRKRGVDFNFPFVDVTPDVDVGEDHLLKYSRSEVGRSAGAVKRCPRPPTNLRVTIESMGTSPWWFASLMTFAGAVLGSTVSIVTVWLTRRYSLQAQLAVKRAEFLAAAEAALRAEREKRYLAILQNLESLYTNAQRLRWQAGPSCLGQCVKCGCSVTRSSSERCVCFL
jgi:hypothetical protein